VALLGRLEQIRKDARRQSSIQREWFVIAPNYFRRGASLVPYSGDQIHSGESGNVGPNSKYFLLVPPWRAPVIASADCGLAFFQQSKGA
jgi:hypothetical protein